MTRRCLAALLAVVLTGCGGPQREPPGIVQGRVTNGGQPVTDANIYFEKQDADYSVFAPLGADGSFQLATHDYGGLPAGPYRIAVRPDPGKMVILAGDTDKQLSHPLIPARFMDVATSGLSAEVKSGTNPRYDFDLGR